MKLMSDLIDAFLGGSSALPIAEDTNAQGLFSSGKKRKASRSTIGEYVGESGEAAGVGAPLTKASMPGEAYVKGVVNKLRRIAADRNSEVFVLAADDPIESKSVAGNLFAGEPFIQLSDFVKQYRRIDPGKNIDLVLLNKSLGLSDLTLVGRILKQHRGKVTAIVPGPTFRDAALLSLAADEILMAHDAWLAFGDQLMKGLEKVMLVKGRRNMDELSLLFLHEGVRKRSETAKLACELLHDGRHSGKCTQAKAIAFGKFDLNNPVRPDALRKWGLKVVTADYFDEIEMSRDPLFSVTVLGNGTGAVSEMIKVLPTCLESCPVGNAHSAMSSMEKNRNSKVISIIHATGTNGHMVDGTTAAEALKAIKRVPEGKSIDLILHTPGGQSIYGEQIARALKAHKGHTCVHVPYYAFSAGTIISLAATEVYMSPFATLGPIDTQFEIGERLQFSAAAFANLLKQKRAKKIGDILLFHAVSAKETIDSGYAKALEYMKGTYSSWRARKIARFLNDGHLTHSYPVMFAEAKRLGLNVRLSVPEEVFTIVDEFTSEPGEFCSVIHCSGRAKPLVG